MITKKDVSDAIGAATAALKSDSLELVVGWRRGRGWAAATIPVSQAVATGLREACVATLARARGVEQPKPFDVDTAIGPGELMAATAADFPDADTKGEGDPLLELLQKESVGETLKPAVLQGDQAQKIAFYAVRAKALELPAEAWIAFLNRADPQMSARPGSFLALFGPDRLDSVEQPVFQFRRSFDIVITSGLVLTSGFASFDILFRQVVEEQAAEMVDELVLRLPASLKLAAESIDLLKQEGRKRPRLRTRVRTLLAKPYLKQLTIESVEAEAQRQNLETSEFMKDGMLFVDPARPTHVINLLDEALVRGGFSGDLFEIEHKARIL